jgi:putative nucleotidyltransferase with HDIG domain
VSFFKRHPVPVNLLVIAITMVFVGAALVVGRGGGEPVIQISVGEPSPQDFIATRTIEVSDPAETEAQRQLARNQVKSVWDIDTSVTRDVRQNIALFFSELKNLATLTQEEADALGLSQEPTDTTAADTTVPETTVAADSTSSTDVGDSSTSTTVAETTTTSSTLPPRDPEDWAQLLGDDYRLLPADAITAFVTLYANDQARIAEGEPSTFFTIEDAADAEVERLMDGGIRSTDLSGIQNEYADPENPPVFIPGLSADERAVAEPAVSQLIAINLAANEVVDDAATEQAREDAAAAVEPQLRTYLAGAEIAASGETLDQVQIDAIDQLGLIERDPGTSRKAIVLLGAIAVLLAAFFLWRIAPSQWSEPRHFALLGILLVLATIVSRIPEVIAADTPQFGYLLPAMMFGYIAAILYEPRTAVLFSVPVAAFTAISTADIGLTVFAAASTVAPVAFVSSVSSRRELRIAVAASAVVMAPLAFSIEWVFTGYETAAKAGLFGLLGGIIAGLAAQGLLSFLENLFRMTTTITLLDLTDRNHPALRLIEEKAPGTFNHSMLVGTLAGKAARAIGADTLLAQATAYYHDLGKTENPQYFIENQFGVSNPHDELDPAESAEIIRAHVIDGQRLARHFHLPSEVIDGIRMHHGTGLMRYFYHKALEQDPGADPELFRHHGEKPRGKEAAILMISDAVEGAARALAQEEDPTAESITKVIDAVVGEKLDDGQLDESALTFGDLTAVKHAMVEALTGYYHTRIPYPGFPGPQAESG